MSAIWGIIKRNHSTVTQEELDKMKEPMKRYKLDRIGEQTLENISFFCGQQYITNEDLQEELPYHQDNFFFTADCMIDNRQELIHELNIASDTTDSELIRRSHAAWGEASVNHLAGVFAYAIYDSAADTFLLYTDHTGSRCIYYAITGHYILFSTIAAPIISILYPEGAKLNECWLSCCESISQPDLFLYPGESAFLNIYQLEPGHYLRVTPEKTSKIEYWNPLKNCKRLKHRSDEEYKHLFLTTFQECVSSVLRSRSETGITLSCGLDSSAVACTAAPILNSRNQQLHSFTSVPLADYPGEKDSYYITDESEGPKMIAQKYNNLQMNYVNCKAINILEQIPELLPALEVPYKSNANLLWLNEIYRNASLQNCQVMLKGQFGNSTISYGAILSCVLQLLLSLHPIRAKKELQAFMKRKRVTRKNVISVAKAELIPRLHPSTAFLNQTFLKDELLTRYRIRNRYKSILRYGGNTQMDTRRHHKNAVYAPDIYQHLGLFDTKLGLMHGIIIRDPCKDKRIIELCLSLPVECFVKNGQERRLIRDYMEGIVPDEIRIDKNRRGLQSADLLFRVNSDFQAYKKSALSYLKNKKLNLYLNQNKVNQLLEALSNQNEISCQSQLQDIFALSSLSFFLDYYLT